MTDIFLHRINNKDNITMSVCIFTDASSSVLLFICPGSSDVVLAAAIGLIENVMIINLGNLGLMVTLSDRLSSL